MSSISDRPTPSWRESGPLAGPLLLAVGALLFAWAAVLVARERHWAAWPLGGAATVALALASLRWGREAARQRERELEQTVAAVGRRNRELELLRGLAHRVVAFRAPEELFDEVARVSRQLLQAEGSAVMLRSPVGEFLQVKAGDGLIQAAVGRLLPVEGSLAGWVVDRGEPLRTEDMSRDARNHPVEGLPPELKTAIVVPLRSRAAIIGIASAYNRTDGQPFSDYDLHLLEAIADHVEIGLDRAGLLEDARRKELALEQEHRELLAATQLKSQFLANMSHELRTPLNAIIGFSDLLLADGSLDDVQRDYLESISRNGKHLLGLITSVLDVSRLEAGRMPTRLGQVDLRRAIEAAVADTESLRSLKRQRCTVEIGDGPLDVMADEQKIRQVLLNLLSNASKFTNDGGAVTLSAVRTELPLPVPSDRAGDSPRLERRDAVWVAVRDTGIGIAPADLSKLFQAFSQVDSSPSRSQQGTGLGLALVKHLVELHGGTIGVESIVAKGSTFWFILPVGGPIRQPVEMT